jgi:hypothetical protein
LLLGWRLDRHGADLVVAERFEERLGVGTVGLVAKPVAPDVLRRQQDGTMSEPLELTRPEMRRAARLEKHGAGRPLGEEARQGGAAQPVALGDPPRSGRDGALEDALCQIDGDASTLGHGLLLSRSMGK